VKREAYVANSVDSGFTGYVETRETL